jgi:hypothetical protein
VSVGIHYPEVFDNFWGIDKRISMIRKITLVTLNKDLIGLSGWSGTSERDKLYKVHLKLGETSLGQDHER